MSGMFAAYLQKNLQLSPALVALPVMLMSIGSSGPVLPGAGRLTASAATGR